MRTTGLHLKPESFRVKWNETVSEDKIGQLVTAGIRCESQGPKGETVLVRFTLSDLPNVVLIKLLVLTPAVSSSGRSATLPIVICSDSSVKERTAVS